MVIVDDTGDGERPALADSRVQEQPASHIAPHGQHGHQPAVEVLKPLEDESSAAPSTRINASASKKSGQLRAATCLGWPHRKFFIFELVTGANWGRMDDLELTLTVSLTLTCTYTGIGMPTVCLIVCLMLVKSMVDWCGALK